MNVMEEEMYSFACKLVHSAGIKLKRERNPDTLSIREKTSQMDIVTEHDVLIEKFLTEAILEKYPGHQIVAEENEELPRDVPAEMESIREPYKWVIDPIDGTINFCRFDGDYTISLAVYKDEKPVFGLVYDVARDTLYSAAKDGKAGISHQPVQNLPRCQDSLNKAVLAMSLRTMLAFSESGMDVLRLLSKAQAHRYSGCASLELCRVAMGKIDFFISSTVYEWDVAAARIFLEACGGYFLSFKKTPGLQRSKLFVAAFRSPLLWEEIIRYLPGEIREKFGA